MVQRLKSISEKIHWSLAAKSAAFALSWVYLPFWAFFILALYFYFKPLFHPLKTILPFAILIFFSAAEEANFWFAIIFAAIFYLILGIKDLILIKRDEAGEVLSLALVFLLAVKFFSSVDRWDGLGPVFYAFIISAILFLLARTFLVKGGSWQEGAGGSKRMAIFLLASAFFSWQALLAALFVPLNFLYQSALYIVATIIFFELAHDHFLARLTRRRALLYFSIFFTFVAVILGSAEWTL